MIQLFQDFHTRPKYKKYGLFDAHTGELLDEFDTRAEAEATKSSWGLHEIRVRGVR